MLVYFKPSFTSKTSICICNFIFAISYFFDFISFLGTFTKSPLHFGQYKTSGCSPVIFAIIYFSFLFLLYLEIDTFNFYFIISLIESFYNLYNMTFDNRLLFFDCLSNKRYPFIRFYRLANIFLIIYN